MKLDVICNVQDEYVTPAYAITPLIKYIPNKLTVWCPFDKADSQYVKLFSYSYNVIHTHIDEYDRDFFKLATKQFIGENNIGVIISNPPYSKKTEVLKRLFELNVPFAMLIGVVGLFESQQRFNMFKNHNFEIMYFNKRVSFIKDGTVQVNPPFSSVYVCRYLLPEQIVFEEIEK